MTNPIGGSLKLKEIVKVGVSALVGEAFGRVFYRLPIGFGTLCAVLQNLFRKRVEHTPLDKFDKVSYIYGMSCFYSYVIMRIFFRSTSLTMVGALNGVVLAASLCTDWLTPHPVEDKRTDTDVSKNRINIETNEKKINTETKSIDNNKITKGSDIKSFTEVMNDFGGKVFEKIRESQKGKSFFYSNINAVIALMSLLTMIKEDKKESFLKTLGFEGMKEQEVHKALSTVFKQNQLSKIGVINIFNTLASKRDGMFHETVTKILLEFYNIDTIIDKNLKDKINEKISQETKGLITDLVKNNDLAAASFSTLYLELFWDLDEPFEKKGKLVFHVDENTTVIVPSLTKTASFRVGNYEGSESIVLPYKSPKNQNISLIIIKSTEVTISNSGIKQALGAEQTPTNLFMPQINLDSPEIDLLDIFTNMKLPIDLDSEMIKATNNLEFIQKSKLEITKHGTKAASATAMLFKESCTKYTIEPKDFKVDCSFTYVIATQDTESKEFTILLSGVISDKSALVLK